MSKGVVCLFIFFYNNKGLHHIVTSSFGLIQTEWLTAQKEIALQDLKITSQNHECVW